MKKLIIFSVVFVMIIGIVGIFAYNYFKPNIINLETLDESILRGKDINNPTDLKGIIKEVEDKKILPVNPRIKVFYQGVEVAYIDHLGNVYGSSGWFTNLNATLTNSSIFYEAGNRLALNTTASIQALVNNSINYSYYCGIPSSVYNVTYDATTNQWNGNSSALIGCINNASYLSTYNATYAGLINNASYLSTFNTTYDNYVIGNKSNFTYWWNNLFGLTNNWLFNNGSGYLSFNDTKLNTTISQEGVRLGFNSTVNDSYLQKAGGTMTGNLNFSNGNNITNPTYIKMKEVSGACDLTINHSICSNQTATYIIG